MKEVWKQHPQYEEVEVSSIGRVRTLDRIHNTARGLVRYKGRLIKLVNQQTNKGKSMYQKCHLYIPSVTSRNQWVHRLVAQTFIDNPNGYKYVDHKDGNGLNNNFTNLEWVSNSENVNRAIAKGNYKNVHYINGKSMRQISLELGSKHGMVVSKRLMRGWNEYDAVNTPIK
jgi:hypothetical protein